MKKLIELFLRYGFIISGVSVFACMFISLWSDPLDLYWSRMAMTSIISLGVFLTGSVVYNGIEGKKDCKCKDKSI